MTLPDSNTIATAYETPGTMPGVLVTETTDPLGRVVRVTTNAAGQKLRERRTLGAANVDTSYIYDPLGRSTGAIDPNGNVWTYTLDTLGRRIAAADPDLGSWSYAYDDAGRLTEQTDALDQVTAFTYDELGRVLTKTSAVGEADEDLITNTYDEDRTGFYNVGQLTSAANSNAVLTHDYDAGGRAVKDTATVDTVTYTTLTSYDAGGRVTGRTYPDATDSGARGYTATGSAKTLAGSITGTTYDPSGRVLTISYSNGVTTTYAYSATRGWVNSISIVKGATTVGSWSYTHDAAGRITAIAGNRSDDSWTYGYDDLDHLLSAANTNTPALSFATRP